ncbi:MAG: OmpA family protein [Acidobacteriota bacterium]
MESTGESVKGPVKQLGCGRSIVMKIRVIAVGLAVLFLACAGSLSAQESGLAEKFMKELAPNLPPSVGQPSSGGSMSKGIGGVTRPPAQDQEVTSKPSTTIHLEFTFNSDGLTPQSVKILDELGKAMQNPVLRGYVFNIEGHTDNVGSDAYNDELSRKRARAVADYMVKTFALPWEQFEVAGFGKRRPVFSNDTESGRAQNRRVVVVNTLKRTSVADRKPDISVKIKRANGKYEEEVMEGARLTQNDSYAIEVMPKSQAYVYIYQVDANGNMDQIFPNETYYPSGSNLMEPGRLYRVPQFGQWLQLDANRGREQIVVIARKTELKKPMEICKDFIRGDDGGTRLASNQTPSSGKKGLGGIREELPARPVVVPTPDPAPVVEPEEIVPISELYRWKLSFNHE